MAVGLDGGCLVRSGRREVRSTAIAEELAQEAFLRLYQRFGEVRIPAGLTQLAAVAALDALQPRSGAAAGFDAPAGASVALLDEVLDPVAPAATGAFTYAEELPVGNVPQGPQLEVRTSAATGSTTVDYLRTWFNGTREADGRASA